MKIWVPLAKRRLKQGQRYRRQRELITADLKSKSKLSKRNIDEYYELLCEEARAFKGMN